MTDTQTPADTTTATDDQSTLPANAIRHPQCGKWWTGLGRSHCAACCETFSCDSAADKHRIGTFGVDRRCAHPSDVGLVARPKPYGDLWGWPSSEGYDLTSRRHEGPSGEDFTVNGERI